MEEEDEAAAPGTPAAMPSTPAAVGTPAAAVGTPPGTPASVPATPAAAPAPGRPAAVAAVAKQEEEEETDEEGPVVRAGKRRKIAGEAMEKPGLEIVHRTKQGLELLRDKDGAHYHIRMAEVEPDAVLQKHGLLFSLRVHIVSVPKWQQENPQSKLKDHAHLSVSGSAKGTIAFLQNQRMTVCTLDEAWRDTLLKFKSPVMADFMKPSVRTAEELSAMGEKDKIAYTVTESHAYLPTEEWSTAVMQAMKDKTIKKGLMLTCWSALAGKEGESCTFQPVGAVVCTAAAVRLTGGMAQLT